MSFEREHDELEQMLTEVDHELTEENEASVRDEEGNTRLQSVYDYQVKDSRVSDSELEDKMSRLVAWTWIPGQDRKVCPSVVDLKSPRLITMDRFYDHITNRPNRIALSMYKANVSKTGRTYYAGPQNVEMFKDFSIRPRPQATGLCLDENNRDVMATALALDAAMEQAARGERPVVQTFTPPRVLAAFPTNYVPLPIGDFSGTMQTELLRMFQPGASLALPSMLSPGGTIVGITVEGNFRHVLIERDGTPFTIKLPIWLPLSSVTKTGNHVPRNTPLASLPDVKVDSFHTMANTFSEPSIAWLATELIKSKTEDLQVEDMHYDRDTNMRATRLSTWRCVPVGLVQDQLDRAKKYLMDFREHLGRDGNMTKVKVEVMRTPDVPEDEDLQFRDQNAGDRPTWYADLITHNEGVPWESHTRLRGN